MTRGGQIYIHTYITMKMVIRLVGISILRTDSLTSCFICNITSIQDLGHEHTDFVEARLGKRIIEGLLGDAELEALAVVSMAGVAAEGVTFPEVLGQTADLMLLQRLMMRAQNSLNANEQQNMTRWAVWQSVRMLRDYEKEYNALMEVMKRWGRVQECIAAIESA